MGRTLREMREAAGLTQFQLAERAGMVLSALARIERGARSPGALTVLALWRALGGDCETFLELHEYFNSRSGRLPVAALRERVAPEPGMTLRQAREAAGVSAENLARYLGLRDVGSYWHIEHSGRIPRGADLLFGLFELYGGTCGVAEWLGSVFEKRVEERAEVTDE